MGSDYNYHPIARFETIAGVEVPLDEEGYHLDPDDRRIGRDGKEEARELTSPYGLLYFAVGYGDEDGEEHEETGDWFRCFDYAELPDGRIILHAVDNSESGGYIEGYAYEVCSKEEAPARALEMVEDALDVVAEHLQQHDEEGWNQDPYNFVRSVARACNLEPYASMDEDSLRRGPVPTFPPPE